MKTNEMKNRPADGPFIRPAAEAQAQAEPEDFARFEGEGGREAPPPDLVDVPLYNAILAETPLGGTASESTENDNMKLTIELTEKSREAW